MSVVGDRTLCGSITGAILAGNVVASGPFLDDSYLMKSNWRAGTSAPSYDWRDCRYEPAGARTLDCSRRSARSGYLPGAGDLRQGPRWRETDEPADLQTLIDDLLSGQYGQRQRVTEPDRSVMEKPGSSPKPLRPVSVEPSVGNDKWRLRWTPRGSQQ
jgi:hypothetical protein